MLEKITNEELQFMEDFHDPIAFIECLFSDVDNLQVINEKFSHVRNYQIPMLSYEYVIDRNPDLTRKENFQVKKGAGDIYDFGARKYGKTLMTLLLDMIMSSVHNGGWKTLFSSYDAVHIRKVLESFIPIVENHPFLRLFQPHVKRSPTYYIRFKNGFTMESVNMNVASKNPGSQFFGHHARKHWMEEASKEIEKVEEKRIDAVSEMGCIERFSGMTDFTKYSPAGKIFYDAHKINWISNYPQYVNPMWDNKEKEKSIKRYGGEASIGYRVFVKGEVVEDAISVFDMERVRKSYDEKREIKHLEVTKEQYPFYKETLIVERPANASVIYLCADIGESAPTEIIVLSKVNDIYKYLYNITLYNLTDKEQSVIFKYLAELLKANFVGLDTTDGTGRAIFRSLEENFGREHLVWCAFNEKIKVDFDKDDNDKVIFKDGQPTYREEYVSEWSIKHLKDLLYTEKIYIPMDYKLDVQLNSVICMQTGNRVKYECVSEEDHLLAAFRVFSIAEWMNCFNLLKPISNKKFHKGGV
jgi:hypothetical protein